MGHFPVIDNELNPFPNKPWFLRVCNTSLLKTQREKEKLLVTSNFSFSHSVFYPSKDLPVISIKFQIVVCNLLLVWKGLNLVVWERVKLNPPSLRAVGLTVNYLTRHYR